jgi:hypothetical protein
VGPEENLLCSSRTFRDHALENAGKISRLLRLTIYKAAMDGEQIPRWNNKYRWGPAAAAYQESLRVAQQGLNRTSNFVLIDRMFFRIGIDRAFRIRRYQKRHAAAPDGGEVNDNTRRECVFGSAVIAARPAITTEKSTMKNLKVLAAATLLSVVSSPVWSQAALQEPGTFAFYYPNRDVLNGGVPQSAYRSPAFGGAFAAASGTAVSSCERNRKAHDPASGNVHGQRHSCD